MDAQVKIHAQRLQRAAADLILDRVVAENGQVPRPTAGGDPWSHRDGQTQFRAGRQVFQVWLEGHLQLGPSAGFARQPAQTIQDEHDDLRLPADDLIVKECRVHPVASSCRAGMARARHKCVEGYLDLAIIAVPV